MNILFYRYGSICEEDVIAAFNEYGLTVYQESTEIFDKKILPARRVDIVSARLYERDYSFVFSINFYPEISSVCTIFKIPYISLIVDSPVLELYSEEIKNPYNRVFIFDRALYNDVAYKNPSCIFHIPLCTNVSRWDDAISNSCHSAFASDLSFVGSLYTEKSTFDPAKISDEYQRGRILGIMEAQLKIYGYYFIDELLTDDMIDAIIKAYPQVSAYRPYTPETKKVIISELLIGSTLSAMERTRLFKYLSDFYRINLYTGSDTSKLPLVRNKGLAKTHTEMPLIFNHSKINLNITSKPIRTGIPLRVFDVLGCGGFLITNYQSELPELFNINEHLVAYESFEDLKEKIDYFLSHDKERREIAHNGYEYVRNNHTYTIRMGQIIAKSFEHI